MPNKSVLQPNELCDLLNYVLVRPRWSRNKIVLERISPVVVRSWDHKHQQAGVEQWCDRQLIKDKVIPGSIASGGRRFGMVEPAVIQQFVIESQRWRSS